MRVLFYTFTLSRIVRFIYLPKEDKTMGSYNNGSVKISEEVIVKIAQMAACEVEGVGRIFPKAVNSKSTKNNKGVILVTEDDGVIVTVQISVLENYKIIEVSEKVQEHVAESISTMAGITVKKVNVMVTGITSLK